MERLFTKIPKSSDEDCTSIVRDVITNDLKIDRAEVDQFQFCGVHCLGKQSRGRPRPIITQFTSRNDQDKVRKKQRNLKGSYVSIGEDLPKHVQEKKRSWYQPWEKARSLDPRNKASVIREKLIVNGKQYLHFNILKRWLNAQPPADSNEEPADHNEEISLNAIPEQQQELQNVCELKYKLPVQADCPLNF